MTLREFFLVTTQFSLLFPIENFSVTLYRKKRRERVRLHAARARRVWGARVARAHFNSNNGRASPRTVRIWLGELRWCVRACVLTRLPTSQSSSGKRSRKACANLYVTNSLLCRSSFLVHFCTAHWAELTYIYYILPFDGKKLKCLDTYLFVG